MKPWRTWLGCLGIFGALTIVSGCGGGDVPDPSSDGQAAAVPESAPPPAPAPVVAAAPAPAEATAPADAAPAGQPAEAPAAEATTAQADAPAPAASPDASAEKPAGGAPAPADRGSATAEMLAMASKDVAPPPSSSPGDAAAGGSNNPAPGMPPGQGGPNQGADQARQMQMQMQMQQRGGRGPGGPGGPNMMGGDRGPGGPGRPGGPDGPSGKPPDFRSPEGAVQAFLDALKLRDLDRLTEATALRAPTESSNKNKVMFERISNSSLSEAELSALADRLEGYKIMMENPAKSTGRVDVVLMKTTRNQNQNSGNSMIRGGGAYYHLKLTVRREKKGWGVCDIGVPTEFKNPAMFNPYGKKTQSRR